MTQRAMQTRIIMTRDYYFFNLFLAFSVVSKGDKMFITTDIVISAF